jgi:helix-turn-helix protein
MYTDQARDRERVRALAQSLDCMTEEDLNLLTDTSPNTTENWRKRGKGPAYVLVGNRYLYPRSAVADFLKANIRERSNAARVAAL